MQCGYLRVWSAAGKPKNLPAGGGHGRVAPKIYRPFLLKIGSGTIVDNAARMIGESAAGLG